MGLSKAGPLGENSPILRRRGGAEPAEGICAHFLRQGEVIVLVSSTSSQCRGEFEQASVPNLSDAFEEGHDGSLLCRGP